MFHPEGILPSTKETFYKIAELDFIRDFVLVGGTGLSVQINHRLSEDLNFCTWSTENFDTKNIQSILELHFDIKQIEQLSVNHIDFYVGDSKTKISFFKDNTNNPIIHGNELYKNIKVASIKAIGAMKLNVLNHRSKFRDLYDLYFICQHENISELLDAAVKFNPRLNQKGYLLKLMNPEKISDENISYLSPKANISASEIRLEIAKQIKEERSKGLMF
jgi:predicted nucleotidyltransferase component of viral defense system